MYELSGATHARQSTPFAPERGASLSTGGRSALGRISPSNGNVSHSCTGGMRRSSATRAYSCSGVSGIDAHASFAPT